MRLSPQLERRMERNRLLRRVMLGLRGRAERYEGESGESGRVGTERVRERKAVGTGEEVGRRLASRVRNEGEVGGV